MGHHRDPGEPEAAGIARRGVVGKGFELVVALAERAARERRPIAFTLIGSVADRDRAARVRRAGRGRSP
jgi:hypothetical protein